MRDVPDETRVSVWVSVPVAENGGSVCLKSIDVILPYWQHLETVDPLQESCGGRETKHCLYITTILETSQGEGESIAPSILN
jgi:hypothetical protein